MEEKEVEISLSPNKQKGNGQYNLMKAYDVAEKMEEKTRPEIYPGDVEDKEVESKAQEYADSLKNVKMIKKGSKFIIRAEIGGMLEDIGVYENEEYAFKRALALKECSVTRCGLHLPYHVRFMLDEFANVGQIPQFTKKLATMRKYEISCTVILQNLAQIKNMYKDDWGSIVGNCDSILLLGSSEYDTQEYFSKKLGKTTITTRNNSESHGSKGSTSSSYQKIARELMLPEEIGQMDDDECILIIRGIYPFRGAKYNYPNHPNYKYTADATKANLYRMNTFRRTALKMSNAATMTVERWQRSLKENTQNEVEYLKSGSVRQVTSSDIQALFSGKSIPMSEVITDLIDESDILTPFDETVVCGGKNWEDSFIS